MTRSARLIGMMHLEPWQRRRPSHDEGGGEQEGQDGERKDQHHGTQTTARHARPVSTQLPHRRRGDGLGRGGRHARGMRAQIGQQRECGRKRRQRRTRAPVAKPGCGRLARRARARRRSEHRRRRHLRHRGGRRRAGGHVDGALGGHAGRQRVRGGSATRGQLLLHRRRGGHRQQRVGPRARRRPYREGQLHDELARAQRQPQQPAPHPQLRGLLRPDHGLEHFRDRRGGPRLLSQHRPREPLLGRSRRPHGHGPVGLPILQVHHRAPSRAAAPIGNGARSS